MKDKEVANIIGYVASVLITINLLPQILDVYKTKNAKAISLTTLLVNILASLLMTIYGLLIHRIPIVISNLAILIFCLILSYFKILYTRI